MGKAPKKRRLKGCPYTVTITCDLTPPYNFIRETQHKTYSTALRVAKKAAREFVGTPGVRIDLHMPENKRLRTSWARILAV